MTDYDILLAGGGLAGAGQACALADVDARIAVLEAVPLQRAEAGNYCKDRFVLIGDAAHSVHPLAGQGLNLGLLDAASLAQVLFAALEKQKDIGSISVLRRYERRRERRRKGENRIMMMIMEGFKYLFENQLVPLPMLRNLGLDIVDSVTPIKHKIMRRAMGLEGDLPDAAKPCS